MRTKAVLLVVLASILVESCASMRQVAKELSAGSCQSECAAKHADSLYDRERCLELLCSPPEGANGAKP